ncbi:diguanylate cyclase [Stagnimonas aquatica]|uniref:diguanylate cyclase n=1 Tax=Stagnimonas aquatica TaxID=2689987 RepID=A0A3N0VLZ2_9GAMM|nr:diguanylate cyclase [Stagnimonas aquatica]ROH93765.1 diguanylate cyclase [Stagnimonas aquatica]
MKILLVDHSPDERQAIRQLLEDDCALQEVDTGAEGLNRVEFDTDCVLVEYALPDLSGVEFLVQLRSQGLDVPVVLLSRDAGSDVAARARQCGADEVLVRSEINADSLRRSIRGAVNRRALESNLRREQARPELIYRLIDESEDLFFALGRHGEIVEANLATERALGFSKQELLGSQLSNHPLFDRVAGRLLDRLRSANLNESLRLEGELIQADGRPAPTEINVMRVRVSGEDFLVAVARNISERKALEEHLRRLSLNDALTGVANRRAFEARLADEWRRAGRSGCPLALLLIDIDHFKAYNDTLGHPAGDACLRSVAARLNAAMRRPEDLLARYGGEEFAVLLPATDTAGAMTFAQHLQDSLRKAALPHPASPSGALVSISIGAATTEQFLERSPSTLVAAADVALYEAKAAGRDCLRFRAA